jgi:hypothetical protein
MRWQDLVGDIVGAVSLFGMMYVLQFLPLLFS